MKYNDKLVTEKGSETRRRTRTRKETKTSLIIGRFQPFHKGHLELVRQVLKDSDKLIIVIGSSQYNYIFKDPFTAGERIEMIHDTLVYEGIDLSRIHIIPLSNIENNSMWLAYLQSMTPEFNVIYSGNEFVSTLASDSSSGYRKKSELNLEVRRPIFNKKETYNGENIRKLIISGKKWQHLVPKQVIDVIERIDGVKRIRVISRTDSNPQKW
jgi:nicotinamide-nucleotide adenylyltransferase